MAMETLDQELALTDSLDASPNTEDTLIVGSSSAEIFTGGQADDVLLGNEGNDILDGGDETIFFMVALETMSTRPPLGTTLYLLEVAKIP